MKILTNWSLCIVSMCLALTSCKDDFDVNKLQDTSRLVVYCFPTEGDTTLIAVTKSLPVSSFQGNKDAQSCQTVDAHIIYKVNGVEQEVKRIADEEEAQRFSRTKKQYEVASKLIGQYYAVGAQKVGDKIEIQVSADGLPSASASTYIPGKGNIKLGEIRFGEKPTNKDGWYTEVNKLEAAVMDDGSSTDYYSVMVKLKQVYGIAKGMPKEADAPLGVYYIVSNYIDYGRKKDEYTWDFSNLYWHTTDLKVLTDAEPLLNKKSQLDDDFGFDDYEYFGNSYIFNDRTINGQTYTLHLEVPTGLTYGNSENWDGLFGYFYCVELYKLTPEYYRYLKSINDAQSNSWADAGLMQVTPTYSNVKGGFGVVGGYNTSTTSRHFSTIPSDGTYDEK